MTRALLELSGPLAVTSANRSGAAPATSIEEARAALRDAVAVYLDGGRCEGAPSSVVSLVDDVELLRAGAVSLEEIHSVIE
jgi:tRNA A37 threonylcarbamoyladenosine synthetase subunit TsaC/SUA5/YrdC